MPNFFEGWYFKQQSGQNMIALIPAVHTGQGKKRTGSVQIITAEKSYYIELPGEEISISRRPFVVRAGNCVFSWRGIELDIQNDEICIAGQLRFGELTQPKGDIMGPYQFVPFMECRHSVFSLTHKVEGSVTLNGKLMDFSGGAGYIEGDRGRSFPRRYAWTHCTWFDGGQDGDHHVDGEPCALMLSAAEVRPFGKPFIGIIGAVYFRGREYRIATYRGAKIVTVGGGVVSVRQGDYTLTAELLESSAQALRAPVSGDMVRLIKESLKCRARYTFTVKDRVFFDYVTERASFEYEFQ